MFTNAKRQAIVLVLCYYEKDCQGKSELMEEYFNKFKGLQKSHLGFYSTYLCLKRNGARSERWFLAIGSWQNKLQPHHSATHHNGESIWAYALFTFFRINEKMMKGRSL